MIVECRSFTHRTEGRDHIIDLSGEVQAAVSDSGVAAVQAALLEQGSTAALMTREYEPGFVHEDVDAGRSGAAEIWISGFQRATSETTLAVVATRWLEPFSMAPRELSDEAERRVDTPRVRAGER